MRFLAILFYLPLFKAETDVSDVADVDFVLVGIRTGQFNPEKILPGIEGASELQNEGLGVLNTIGTRQALAIGKHIRKRYENLLKSSYDAKSIRAYSSSDERNRATIQGVLAGLIPETGWVESNKWEAIPTKINDPILKILKTNCGLATSVWSEIDEGQLPSIRYSLDKDRNIINYVAKNTGWNTSLASLSQMSENLINVVTRGLSLPNWIVNSDAPGYDGNELYSKLLQFHDAREISCANYMPCQKIMGGPLLSTVLEQLKRKHFHLDRELKLVLFVADTEVILSLMKLIGYNVDYLPYSSGFILEYRNTSDADSVRPLFHRPERFDPDQRMVSYQMKQSFCEQKGEWCALNRFSWILKGQSVSNWKTACGEPYHKNFVEPERQKQRPLASAAPASSSIFEKKSRTNQANFQLTQTRSEEERWSPLIVERPTSTRELRRQLTGASNAPGLPPQARVESSSRPRPRERASSFRRRTLNVSPQPPVLTEFNQPIDEGRGELVPVKVPVFRKPVPNTRTPTVFANQNVFIPEPPIPQELQQTAPLPPPINNANQVFSSQIPPQNLFSQEACRDGDETYCPFWAGQGGCQSNPLLMLTNCQKSCDCCGCSLSSVIERLTGSQGFGAEEVVQEQPFGSSVPPQAGNPAPPPTFPLRNYQEEIEEFAPELSFVTQQEDFNNEGPGPFAHGQPLPSELNFGPSPPPSRPISFPIQQQQYGNQNFGLPNNSPPGFLPPEPAQNNYPQQQYAQQGNYGYQQQQYNQQYNPYYQNNQQQTPYGYKYPANSYGSRNYGNAPSPPPQQRGGYGGYNYNQQYQQPPYQNYGGQQQRYQSNYGGQQQQQYQSNYGGQQQRYQSPYGDAYARQSYYGPNAYGYYKNQRNKAKAALAKAAAAKS